MRKEVVTDSTDQLLPSADIAVDIDVEKTGKVTIQRDKGIISNVNTLILIVQ
jgi:hypothetical protein